MDTKKRSGTGAGFTLIELLVVMAVIGVLAGSLMVVINPLYQLRKAQDGTRQSDLRQIQSGLELYRADKGSYPVSLGSSLVDGSTTYMKKIPNDPNGGTYDYRPTSPPTSYVIYACAGNKGAPGAIEGVEITCTTGWYFKVESP